MRIPSIYKAWARALHNPCMVVHAPAHACNLTNPEAEAGGFEVEGHSQLYSKLERLA